MKKHCCSYNSAITRDKLCCNNHDLTCCKSELYFRSDDNTQRDFSDKQNSTGRKQSIDNSVRHIPKTEQTKEKNLITLKTSILFFC